MSDIPEYKVIHGSASGDPSGIEQQINQLAKEGWRPIAMGGFGTPGMVAVILEKKNP
jgi:hypothetical protein